MKISGIALFILGVFAVLGGAFLSVALHELSHKADFSDIQKNNEELCLVALPSSGSLGYYRFDTNQTSQTAEIDKYTEFKAYLVTISVLLLLVLCFTLAFIRFQDLRYIEKESYKDMHEIVREIKRMSR